MPLKEPTPPEKIFTDEFAKNGEVQKVPNDLQADENLSWLGGFTKRFSGIPIKERGLNIIRQTFAGIVQPLSAKILQVEKDLRVRFLKADNAKIKNNDISFLETQQLTTQNLNTNKAKIVDFTKELIKPSEKTIITNLTQNAGVISGIDNLNIADKAESVNIILSPNTSQSVLNNTPSVDVNGKELVNAEWVYENFGIANSPYIHNFVGLETIIPYIKITGLSYIKIAYQCYSHNPYCGLFFGVSSPDYCHFYAHARCHSFYELFVKLDKKMLGQVDFNVSCCETCNTGHCESQSIPFSYNSSTGVFKYSIIPLGNDNYCGSVLKTTLTFSVDGKD